MKKTINTNKNYKPKQLKLPLEIEKIINIKACRTDIRYMWLLEDCDAPSFMTISNFIKKQLTANIEKIFVDINKVIFEKDNVDLTHTYIDGTKIEANANKYSWVWKKSCIKNRDKTFEKLTILIDKINKEDLLTLGIKIETRSEYALEYIEEIIDKYKNAVSIDINTFVNGRGHRKSKIQKNMKN